MHYALLSFQPTYIEQAVKENEWDDGMNEEMDSIERNDTWDLLDLPVGKSSIGVKCVYKTKLNGKLKANLRSIKQDLLQKVLHNRVAYIMMKYFP